MVARVRGSSVAGGGGSSPSADIWLRSGSCCGDGLWDFVGVDACIGPGLFLLGGGE